ncbi:GNAT family N-acetyltransferase [Actinomadura sp. 6N118]|uniref:GNAT family N-acetyltransferase n=1 Tax=Actinomadura sp. 6N118 TaxID=3375151 RepID=UPI00379FA792
MADLTFRRFDTAGAREQRDTVSLIHQDAYADRIASGAPFYSVEAFMQRFDAYTSRDGLDLVIGYEHDEPIGQTWGWPLGPNSRSWEGLEPDPDRPADFTAEDGRRTFALSEIMVRQAWTGRGYAHALHDELLRGRPEQRAMLLVNPTNERAQRAYSKWGWQQVGRLTPSWDNAPRFHVLMLNLPVP